MFEKNLAALSRRAPELAELVRHAASVPFESCAARSGAPSARASGVYLHSRYDPEGEARNAVKEALAQGADMLVCLGMGLGYQVAEALASGTIVLAVEADPAWLRSCMEAAPMESILADPRLALVFCADGNGILAALHELNPRAVAVMENPALSHAFPDQVADFRAAIGRYLEKDRINANTLKRFGKLWVRNIAQNAGLLGTFGGIAELEGLFAGKPAIVLAAGPSLDEILPHLAELQKCFVLVCVDTSLRSVLAAGVEPDFVVVVDPQYWNARHLDRCGMGASILISEAAVWPSVFRMQARAVFLCSSIYPLGRYLEEKAAIPLGQLGAGGSVATTAWDFARVLGCSPIYMAGLDLSFPGGKTHARASLFEQRSLTAGTRLRPASLAGFEAMRGGHPYLCDANDGSRVVSDKRLSLYAWWFTRTTVRYPDTQTVNLSERGLKIEGMPCGKISELSGSMCIRDELDRLLASACQDRLAARHRNPGAMERVIGALCDELSSIESLAVSTIACAVKAKKMSGAALGKILRQLDDSDAKVSGSAARDVVGFLFPELGEILGERAKTLEESLQKTMDVYERIKSSARWHREILGRPGLPPIVD